MLSFCLCSEDRRVAQSLETQAGANKELNSSLDFSVNNLKFQEPLVVGGNHPHQRGYR